MSVEIKVSSELDRLLRKSFSDAGVRLTPDAQSTEIVSRLNAIGVSVEIESGVLSLKDANDGRQFNTSLALRGLSTKPDTGHLFITDNSNPKDWTVSQRVAFINAHGADAWGRKVNGTTLQPGVRVLDRNMTKKEYLSLTRAERIAFIR